MFAIAMKQKIAIVRIAHAFVNVRITVFAAMTKAVNVSAVVKNFYTRESKKLSRDFLYQSFRF
jgi:hypothetical protein